LLPLFHQGTRFPHGAIPDLQHPGVVALAAPAEGAALQRDPVTSTSQFLRPASKQSSINDAVCNC
jgi:hypothetical protein